MNNNDNDSSDRAAKDPLSTVHVASSLFGAVGSPELYIERMRAATQPLGGVQKIFESMLRVDTSALTQISPVCEKLVWPTQQLAWLPMSSPFIREMDRWKSFQQEVERALGQQESMAKVLALSNKVFVHDLDRVGSLLSELSINVNYPRLSERMLAPLTYYGRFSRETLSALQHATEGRARALSGSLLLAEDQLTATTDLLANILQRPIGPDCVGAVPAYTLFERIRDDLLEAEQLPPVDEPERLSEISRSANLAVDVRLILKRTASCNRNAQMNGEDEVFRPTTGMLEAAADLGFLALARDEGELGTVVDALYKLLYEGAGADSLRYLKRGYISDEECGVIWSLKDLRNFWLRHDHGHGSKSEQKRKMKKLRITLGKYGLNGMPSTPADYEKLHLGLVRDVCDFLGLLEKRIP